MDFDIPASTQQFLGELDQFIIDVIKPMEDEDDNIRFFDHRREDSRTDWDRDGLPNAEWEGLLRRMRVAADQAGYYRHQLPERFGGKDAAASRWRSFASTSRAKASGCTMTSRTRARSSATSSPS